MAGQEAGGDRGYKGECKHVGEHELKGARAVGGVNDRNYPGMKPSSQPGRAEICESVNDRKVNCEQRERDEAGWCGGCRFC